MNLSIDIGVIVIGYGTGFTTAGYRAVGMCMVVWQTLSSRELFILFPSNRLSCQPTNECTDRNQTSDLSKIECCDGYQTRPADQNDHYTYYYQTYYQSIKTTPVGCPRGARLHISHVLVLHVCVCVCVCVRTCNFFITSIFLTDSCSRWSVTAGVFGSPKSD